MQLYQAHRFTRAEMSSRREKLRYLFQESLKDEDGKEIALVNYKIYYRCAPLLLFFDGKPYFSKIEESCVVPKELLEEESPEEESPDDVKWTARREYDENGKLIENESEFLINEMTEPIITKQVRSIKQRILYTETDVYNSTLAEKWCRGWVIGYSYIEKHIPHHTTSFKNWQVK